MSSELISALQNPALYDHPVEEFQVFETHISWVILTGQYAYKVKKPMDFGFLDFSTLARREHFCKEEIRLNRRLAPDLYLDTLPLTGTPDKPVIGGDGEPFEYINRMRQFDQSGLLDVQQENGTLEAETMAELARQVAAFHHELPQVGEDKPFGTPEAVLTAMQENFDQIRPMLDDQGLLEQLDALEAWTQTTFARQANLVQARRDQGFVRECHGDLHLANIAHYNGEVTVFDCIEFSEPFRWIDVMTDLAFLLMDLESRGEYALASKTLNIYLEYSGDYRGLELLPLYKAYRAMVRAKIALFTRENPGLSDSEKAGLLDRYRSYAKLADGYSAIPNSYLLVTTGLSGSGKTFISGALADQLCLIRLRSDVERKRLHGLGPLDNSHTGQHPDIYTAQANQKTYEHLANLSRSLLDAGIPVIVDAACLRQAERELLETAANGAGAPFALLNCQAPETTRREWIRDRSADASEATEDLLAEQEKWVEPLNDWESNHTVHVRTDADDVPELLVMQIRKHFGAGC